MKRLARTGIFPVLLFFASADLGAQGLVRSWLPWRTIETRDFRFHYPVELEDWTRSLAGRADAIDSAVGRIVGYVPPRKTDVVVDDPYNSANGSAWPFLNRPVINVWATPPDPREDIGEYRDWGRTLLSHEFTHIAHLSRPSRNAFTRHLWALSAIDLGPMTINAPRWVIEGYATFAEGRVTGSGRPHGAWRAAYLRQWALEGQLPRYDQLNNFGGFDGGEFAYLAGSAFLEWLADAHGDSSLVDVWRRMTAKQVRGFDEAFAGVYGESARALYGKFSAELTGKAIQIERSLRAGGVPADTGEIIQRLSWSTGDPAISRDGRRVAIALASPSQPSHIVIWNTATEPDTGRARRDSLLRKSDPEDVPARSIYPPPKRVLASLRVKSGSGYESPRFMSDGRILLTRMMWQRDGSRRPDLFIWSPARRSVQRVTHNASLRDADPSPDGKSAVAAKCEHGWCDVVRVDLATGKEIPIAGGSPARSYFRPRFSPDGRYVLLTYQAGGRWRLMVTAAPEEVGRSATFDGNAYDGVWISNNEIVATVDQSGIPQLVAINIDTHATRTLTGVTGAAVGAERSPADSSIWFLSLYSRGYDLRRVRLATTADSGRFATMPKLAPAGMTPPVAGPALDSNAVSAPRSYGLGARLFRWLPLPQGDADGLSGVLALSSNDIVGRSEVMVKLAAGTPRSWRGGDVDFTWRGFRPFLRASAFDAQQDVHMRGGLLYADQTWTSEGWSARARLGASAAALVDTSSSRTLAVGDASAGAVQRNGLNSVSESLGGSMTLGNTFGTRFYRGTASAGLSAFGYLPVPVSAAATYARTSHDAPVFEQIALGGGQAALLDRLLLTQRIPMGALPSDVSIGTSAFVYRISLNTQPLNVYWWAGSTTIRNRFSTWNRVVGLEGSQAVSAIPYAGIPSARVVYGVGESLDAPLRKQVRAYLSVVVNP